MEKRRGEARRRNQALGEEEESGPKEGLRFREGQAWSTPGSRCLFKGTS